MISSADDNNVLDRCTAPVHAFPSPFPPVCSYEPFPLESRSHMFSVLQWRCPNHKTSRSSEIDVNDLVDQFALLSVRDVYSKRSQKNCGAIQDSLAALHAITITPPPAPHPALIRPTKIVSSLTRWSPFPIVRASQPTPQVFTASPSPISPPLPSKDVSMSRRKVSPLPKRYPRSPLPRRNATPATSDTSSSASSPCSSVRSLSDSFDSGRTLSPVPRLDPPAHCTSSTQPQVCPTTQAIHPCP